MPLIDSALLASCICPAEKWLLYRDRADDITCCLKAINCVSDDSVRIFCSPQLLARCRADKKESASVRLNFQSVV